MALELVSLRQRPELRRQTADLLNTEWPRSLEARLVACMLKHVVGDKVHVLLRLISLEEGEGDLPCSLILLQTCQQSGDTCVVGHVRIIAAAGRSRAALVEACKLIF